MAKEAISGLARPGGRAHVEWLQVIRPSFRPGRPDREKPSNARRFYL
jgi:hypothetical protein